MKRRADFDDRPSKAQRTRSAHRLPTARLLEGLGTEALVGMLHTLSQRHPELDDEMRALVPRPSLHSTLAKLHDLSDKITQAFPYGGDPAGEYAHQRVQPCVQDLLAALEDYTPHFLLPLEQQPMVSLAYLDGVSALLHKLPGWATRAHNAPRRGAYEAVARAWITTIKEAAKRGGGVGLVAGGWLEKIQRHDALADGLLQDVVQTARDELGWLGTGRTLLTPSPQPQLKTWA